MGKLNGRNKPCIRRVSIRDKGVDLLQRDVEALTGSVYSREHPDYPGGENELGRRTE